MLCACNIKYRQSGNSEGLGRTCSYARSFELPKRPFLSHPHMCNVQESLMGAMPKVVIPFPNPQFPASSCPMRIQRRQYYKIKIKECRQENDPSSGVSRRSLARDLFLHYPTDSERGTRIGYAFDRGKQKKIDKTP